MIADYDELTWWVCGTGLEVGILRGMLVLALAAYPTKWIVCGWVSGSALIEVWASSSVG